MSASNVLGRDRAALVTGASPRHRAADRGADRPPGAAMPC